MFYLQYLKAELTRRFGKTLTIALGLAIAGAIIIIIISLSQGLSSAQEKVLNPLQNVGTDIMVSRSVDVDNMKDLDEATRTELQSENRVSTDLSKLGNPGDQFSNDAFLTGTMLTFASDESKKLDSSLVSDSAQGLILNVTHQEGKIPQVTAEFKTGGEQMDVNQQMTSEQRQAMQDAMKKAEEAVRAKGLDPRSEEGRKAMDEAMKSYLPNFSTRITTPERTYRQNVGPISTDIKTENYTVAGVDTTKDKIGLILSSQLTSGNYFNGADQIIVSQSFAQKQNIKLGDKFTLGKKEFTVVALVEPQLYTNTADLYLPLLDLQKLAGRENRINILLVKSTNSGSVEETSKKIAGLFAGAKITSSSDTAKKVSGSLVSAASLTNRFIGVTSIIVVLAAFIIVSLLTILSVNKRTREIGTLKAIGWRNSEIIRQILMENVLIGIFGAILGVGLGLAGIYVLNHFNISLSANIASTNTGEGFMRRFMGGGSSDVKANVDLKITYNYIVLTLGAGIALIGSILAGGLAAFKSSRMRAQEALRNLE
ncbi:MAG: FtsX-like permease family protein [Candidatus Berkelbacteria bacterium]|nr:FtsX-like permease family protein [Candidatus Berkelbacteria bacterium]